MLKWVIGLLVLGNAGYFAWSQGYLEPMGLAPADQREPQRLAQQVRPDVLRLLNGPRAETALAAPTPTPAPSPAAPVPATAAPKPPAAIVAEPVVPTPLPSVTAAVAAGNGPRTCWQATGFTDEQAELLRAELALLGVPASGFAFTEVRSGGRWIVYMGRYDNQQQVERKKEELRALGVSFREITAPGLAPGLALGTYSTEAAAQQALQKAERDGIRTGKVAQERAESVSLTVRLPSITDTQQTAIDGLGEAMAGKRLQRCN